MSREPNNKADLQARAKIYQQIREFFATRGVLEVETPLMCAHTVSDPYIKSFAVENYFLQTSPEYAMKRLLVAGSGCIYQICKAFRCEEAGNQHNPEFTMLEWYRLGFDHLQLMDEVDQLMQLTLSCPPARKLSYYELFMQFFGFNPHTANLPDLITCLDQQGVNLSPAVKNSLSATDCLQLLMSHIVEPQLTGPAPWIIYEFPKDQAALAKVLDKEYPVAARFEVYADGLELANGYYELQDPTEQRRRFMRDNAQRNAQGLATIAADERLLTALAQGMPDCAGVALGIDRLLMLKSKKTIKEVLAFPIEHA